MWAYAKLEYHPGAACLEFLTTNFLQQASRAQPQNISNTMWACAELAWRPGPPFVEVVCSSILRNIAIADAQCISNFLSACVKLGQQPGAAFIHAASDQMQQLMDHSAASEQAVSNMLWACAKLGASPPTGFMRGSVVHIQRLLPSVPSSQAIALLLWAYQTLRFPLSDNFLEAVAGRFSMLLPCSNSTDMRQISAAYAYYEYVPRNGLLPMIAQRYQELQHDSQ